MHKSLEVKEYLVKAKKQPHIAYAILCTPSFSYASTPFSCLAGAQFGLYKILFHFETLVHESIILSLPPPTCIARTIAMLLHVYWAIYDAPPTPLVYAIHHTILAMAISFKGQGAIGTARYPRQHLGAPRSVYIAPPGL